MRHMTVLVKPASSLCNLKCSYCFYSDEAENRKSGNESVMTAATAENLIKKVFDFCGDNSVISFMFQGGEPLIAGVDFFKEFIRTADTLKDKDTKIAYSLQTNGTLISDEFAELFKENDFLIGVSVDGDEATHNRNRCGSFETAMNGIEILRKHGVDFNILSVITAQTDAAKLFEFYKKNGFSDVQPIYCLDPLDGAKNEYSLDAKSFARFQKRFFNLWFGEISRGNRFYVRDFDNLISLMTNGYAEQCGASGRCNAQLVVEADGTCYPCDFYCLDEYECPNINTASINDILESEGLKKFMSFDEPKNKLCDTCPVRPLCNGGCKRYRKLYNQLSGYCPRMDFIVHAVEKLRNVR